ncbi:uncharacterized protein V6R79_013708 [Siganus canaliculatus]
MDPDKEAEVFSDDLRPEEEEEREEEEGEEQGEGEEEEEDEEEDARIFNAWMQRYRAGDLQEKIGEEEEEEEEAGEPVSAGGRTESRTSIEAPVNRPRVDRRASLPCPSDADRVCLICHNDLNQGSGTRELQCNHTFHKECIEEWLWRKQSCPTCHVQVSIPQPVYWNSTRVKVP